MASVIQPGAFIASHSIDDKSVVALPVSYRITVPPGVRRVGGPPAHILGKFPTVRPDFAPDSVVLGHLDGFARHFGEHDSSGHEQHVAREPEESCSPKCLAKPSRCPR